MIPERVGIDYTGTWDSIVESGAVRHTPGAGMLFASTASARTHARASVR